VVRGPLSVVSCPGRGGCPVRMWESVARVAGAELAFALPRCSLPLPVSPILGTMVVMATVGIIAGLVLLTLGGEFLVRGSVGIAAALRISPLVIGLTVVAFGTSSPELAVSITSSWQGEGDMAVGNVVGSNICNVLLILGMSAMIAPLIVSSQLIRFDVPLMVGISFAFFFMGLDGAIDRLDGLLFVLALASYVSWSIWKSRSESPEIQEEYAKEYGQKPKGPRQLVWHGFLVLAGLATLSLGSNWLVASAMTIARAWGVSELLIGLTIVSIGTSLPEVATSLVAAYRGERDIAVGNVVGSNIFNILAVLGISALVAPSAIRVPIEALRFDIPVMLAVSVACLPIFFTEHRIARWEGALFFGYYVAYLVYLVLAATRNEFLSNYQWVMSLFVIPLTCLTLAICVVRHYVLVRHNAVLEASQDSS
jgi:cation:H+ antiporter